jgi:hypothetical protein
MAGTIRSMLPGILKSRDRKNKKKNHRGQQEGRLKKPKIMKSDTNSQHTITGISKVA